VNIKISRHAAERIKERGITEEQVRAVFASENVLDWKVSDSDESVLLVDTVVNGKKYRFAYNVLSDILVTVYPLRK